MPGEGRATGRTVWSASREIQLLSRMGRSRGGIVDTADNFRCATREMRERRVRKAGLDSASKEQSDLGSILGA